MLLAREMVYLDTKAISRQQVVKLLEKLYNQLFPEAHGLHSNKDNKDSDQVLLPKDNIKLFESPEKKQEEGVDQK